MYPKRTSLCNSDYSFPEVDSTVRASFALYNTREEVDILVNAVNGSKHWYPEEQPDRKLRIS